MSIYNVIEFEGVMHFVNRTHLERERARVFYLLIWK